MTADAPSMQTPITGYASVKYWCEEFAHFWGIPVSRTTDQMGDRVAALERFCARTGKTPDEIVEDCLRPSKVGEGLQLRTKARRGYIQQINEFEQAEGSRDAGNSVRSFFIHNGIAMTPAALR